MPSTRPLRVTAVRSATTASPRSMTCASPERTSTLPGVRSRCTTPAACRARSARATPRPSRTSPSSGSGPDSATSSSSRCPGTNRVTIQGVTADASPPRTSTRCGPRTRCSTSSSRRNRRRPSASTQPSRSTLTATTRSSGVTARKTVPMPPWPRRPRSRCGPTRQGSPGRRLSTATGTPPSLDPGRAQSARRPVKRHRAGSTGAGVDQCRRWSCTVSRGPKRGLAAPLHSSRRTTR